MINLYNLLVEIHEQPLKYLRKPTLKYLHTFMSGYLMCLGYLNKQDVIDFYQDFQIFIQNKYEILLTLHYTDIIQFYCVDEEEAFERYFELLDEYVKGVELSIETGSAVMNNIYDVLQIIKKRPKLYLARVSLVDLHVFINGYIACMNEYDNKKHDFYPDFQEFVQQKYDVKFYKHWSDIIQFYSGGGEEAFNKFFQLLDEFMDYS